MFKLGAVVIIFIIIQMPVTYETFVSAADENEEKSEAPSVQPQDYLTYDSVIDLSTKGITYSNNQDATDAISAQLTFFSETIRKKFNQWLVKGSRYLPVMKKILKENDLPEELVYLPLIESGYNNMAKSPANAAGPWQFVAGTARDYNLKINYWVDERHDPIKSTHAASKYLKSLFDKFGTWDLALAAYNAGEIKIGKALKMANTDNYWNLISTGLIAKETKLFVPKFIAAREIAIDPGKYGFDDIGQETPMQFDIVVVAPPATLNFISKASGTSTEIIRELNPELKQWCIPPDVPKYRLRVPHGKRGEFLRVYENTPEHQRYMLDKYRAKKGDTLNKISKRLHMPQGILSEINSKPLNAKLKEGTLVYLPPSNLKHKDTTNSNTTHKGTIAKNIRPKEKHTTQVGKKPAPKKPVPKKHSQPHAIKQRQNHTHAAHKPPRQ